MTPIPSFTISCPTEVRFGLGVHEQLASLLPRGGGQVILISGLSGIAARPVLAHLQDTHHEVTGLTCAKEPSVADINALLEQLSSIKADAIVACGGGAVIDTAKALAFCIAHDLRLSDDFSDIAPDILARPGLIPLIVLPTTAGTGAEVTANAVLDVPSKRAKVSLRGRALFPTTALVDPGLMMSAPPQVILNAGLDAVTQIIEAYTSAAATPFSDALTAPNILRGLEALRAVMEQRDVASMTNMAWVSLSSGLALANAGLGAAHGLASVVGGRYAAPHGALCGRFLIPVLRQNFAHTETGSEGHRRLDDCNQAIASVFPPTRTEDVLSGLDLWIKQQGLPRLVDYSVHRSDFGDLAHKAVMASSSKKNVVPLSKASFLQILESAF